MAAVKTQSVPAVERALTLLEVLAESKRGYTLSELARLLRLPRSSTHCLLLTLERRGYLHRNEQTGRYMFGLKLLGLANKALSRIELRERAAPYLQALMQQTGLTVHLAILDRGEAVLVEKVEPPGLLRLATWIGKRMDIHCTGVGKALLAYLPEEEIERLIRERGLPRHNENTIASPKRLREELARIRAQGYSLDDEEDEVGLRCLGAPIFDHTGRVVASISVAGTIAQ
ncbi:MAG: IclR family transcriptional regulator, partial [Acidobacteriota bacterium]|nr:IclR family transcriptional regulator [Acidobacteriota bacterium]